MTIRTITKNFLNLIYPTRCYACKIDLDPTHETGLCDLCRSRIRRNPRTYRTDRRSYFAAAYSAYLYEDVLKELIHLYKYNGKVAIGRILAGMMIDFMDPERGILDGIDLITFVPLQNARLRERGFNQSRILAFHISNSSGIKLSDILEKTRRTRHQNELLRDDRLSNLKGAFRVKKNTDSIAGLRVLLIDDVMTTGATLNECSKVLSEAGAREIKCLTLARGL